jgi:peptidyl-prolyl cis-trans isomerase B (cyclophilin B)
MIGTAPGANGSQFLIFFNDFTPTQPSYPIVGRVTNGLDVVKAIGAVETVDNGSGAKVKPKTDVVIESLTVGPVASDAATPTTTGSASPSAASQS